MIRRWMNRRAVLLAMISAALFGLSTPAAKVLLGAIHPALLAGLLYFGAGAGIAVLRRLRRGVARDGAGEAALTRMDWPWLAAAIAVGGIVGPLLLMAGLARTDASAASLLLAFEGAATALIAWFVFREHVSGRIAIGMLALVAGALALSWTGQPTFENAIGPLAIVGACAAWGLDNNLTRKVSLADPLQIVEMKGLIAGPCNIAIGLWAGGQIPGAATAVAAGLVGFLGYGVSLALFVLALRDLGTARTSAYFSTAPFLGALVAIAALGEPLTVQFAVAGALMAAGVWLHLTEWHAHEHVHERMAHAHAHVHDAHHRHVHSSGDPPGEPHTHWHEHPPMTHSHPHTPDMHHRHKH